MDIALDNVDHVLDASPPEKLTQVFSKLLLLDPTRDRIFVPKYMDAIASRLQAKGTKGIGLDIFGKTCVSAGIVKTISELVKLNFPSRSCPKEMYMAQYKALVSLYHLFAAASAVEKRTLIDQFLSHGVYRVLMQTLSHPICMLRFLAAENIIITVAGFVPLERMSTKVTISVAAGILVGLCQLALEGSEKLKEQLKSPAHIWTRKLPWTISGVPILKHPTGVDWHFARFQEYIVAGACWFIRACRPLCETRFEVLKDSPEILDILFDCAIIPRPTLFPTSTVCTLACEALTSLFILPAYIVPGVPTPLHLSPEMQDWKPSSQCLAILTSRKDWADKIIETWMKVEEEEYLGIRSMIERDLLADPRRLPVDVHITRVAENRGLIRITILRIISTLTHVADSCGITNAEIESLLRIAYTACRRICPEKECRSSAERLLHAERTIGDSQLHLSAHRGDSGPIILFTIGYESILGPIALTRLLVVLAQRNVLDGIQCLKKHPKALSSYTSLHHVQQITHPLTIQRFLTIAMERVVEGILKGHSRFSESMYEPARGAFTTSAELAAALVAFDIHTKGQYSNYICGARRELVIALSNASAVALMKKDYMEVQSFAFGALSAAENVPATEGLDPSIAEKCRMRIKQARNFSGNERH